MLNSVNLTGRLTRDPELRFTPEGVPVANMTLAVNRAIKPKNGGPEADFFPLIVWRERAEVMANHLKKGSLIGVTGKLQTRDYESHEGKKMYITEVVVSDFSFLESKKEEEKQAAGATSGGYVSKYTKR
jgi:single-strand DNA-binding protein